MAAGRATRIALGGNARNEHNDQEAHKHHADSNYSAFVNNLTNIKRQSLETGDFEKNQEILRAEFSYFYVQGITDTLHLYRQKSGKTVAVLNDKIICFVDSDYVDQVVQQVSLLRNSNVLIPLINEGGSVSDTSKVS